MILLRYWLNGKKTYLLLWNGRSGGCYEKNSFSYPFSECFSGFISLCDDVFKR